MRYAMIFCSPWGWMGIVESTKGFKRSCCRNGRSGLLNPNLESTVRSAIATRGSQRNWKQLVGSCSIILPGRRNTFDVPLDLSQGTSFQRQVWRTLQRVPYGKLRSYQWIARRVGGRHYARAVGNAVGANPLPIVVPCHRIVAHDASLGGLLRRTVHETQVAVP